MWKRYVQNARKLCAFLRPADEGCSAHVRKPEGTRAWAGQPAFEGRSFACFKDTKIKGEMQVFDLLFLNFSIVFELSGNGVLFEDKSPCLLAYVGFCMYLAVD